MADPQSDRSSTPRPALPNRLPFFYGWVVLGVGLVGMVMTSPGQTYSVSIVLEPIIAELGLSRSLVSTLYTGATMVGSLALPLVGRVIDRRGPRWTLGVVATLFGLACLYMGLVQNVVMLAVGFVLIRMLGQGSLMLVSQNLINRWWIRRRGLVMGIAGMAMSVLGLGGFPNLIHVLTDALDWQRTYMVLGGLLLGTMVPIGLVFARDRPEDHGLRPDGDSGPPHAGSAGGADAQGESGSAREVNWELGEAIRTLAFWVVAASVAAKAMISTGLVFHMVSIFADNGLSAETAAAIFVPIAVTTAIMNLGGGVLADYLSPRWLLVVALVSQAGSLLLATHLASLAIAVGYGITLGITDGLTRTVNSMIWASYYGRAHLGRITGVTTTVVIFGSALGPMPFGIARDVMGTYGPMLTAFAVIPFGLAVANALVPRPVKKAA